MAASPSLDLVEGCIDQALTRFDRKCRYYRRGSLVQALLAATTGAITTFLIGADGIFHRSSLTVLALAASALTTVIGAWNAWFGFKPLWVHNQNVINALYVLRDRIRWDRSVAPDQQIGHESVKEYFDTYQRIMAQANAEWSRIRLAKD